MLDSTAGTTEPFTGAEYLESIRDGREVYIYGDRVEGRDDAPGVPQHRAARSPGCTTRCTTRQRRPILTTPTDTGSGGVHPQVLPFPAHGRRRGRRPARRSPNGRGSATAGWAAAPTTRRPSWPRSARTPTSTTPIRTTRGAGTRGAGNASSTGTTRSSTRPSTATGRPRRSATSSCTWRRSATTGIVVSGAKVVATGSALTHYNFIAHYGPIPLQKKEYALVCAVLDGHARA